MKTVRSAFPTDAHASAALWFCGLSADRQAPAESADWFSSEIFIENLEENKKKEAPGQRARLRRERGRRANGGRSGGNRAIRLFVGGQHDLEGRGFEECVVDALRQTYVQTGVDEARSTGSRPHARRSPISRRRGTPWWGSFATRQEPRRCREPLRRRRCAWSQYLRPGSGGVSPLPA